MDLDEISFLRKLGQRIRNIREERKLTQQQLADRSGLHRTFIGSVERGERNLSVLNLRIFAKSLRVPISELTAGGT
ncbi:MAG TPA: helix-turn-helix transcriptional regulator [Planctomycetaceae bacterium]|nr:helix-turn-helix transcriptional regulator [Planctomycetaceae bacterium]